MTSLWLVTLGLKRSQKNKRTKNQWPFKKRTLFGCNILNKSDELWNRWLFGDTPESFVSHMVLCYLIQLKSYIYPKAFGRSLYSKCFTERILLYTAGLSGSTIWIGNYYHSGHVHAYKNLCLRILYVLYIVNTFTKGAIQYNELYFIWVNPMTLPLLVPCSTIFPCRNISCVLAQAPTSLRFSLHAKHCIGSSFWWSGSLFHGWPVM